MIMLSTVLMLFVRKNKMIMLSTVLMLFVRKNEIIMLSTVLMLFFLTVSIRGVHCILPSCNKQYGCLKIYKKDEKTLLSCGTSSLDNSVEFLDPSGKYYRYCHASLYGDRKNCSKHVSRDKFSNVTTLTLYNPFDTDNFGEWKCVHGTNQIYDTCTVQPYNFLRSKSNADITSITSDFFGQALRIGKGFFFQFTCTLFQIPEDNSFMFLVNERTVDILRFEKMDCYNIKGKCTERTCSCSLSNKTFRWFYSLSSSLKKCIFEVQARYSDKSTRKLFKISLSRTFHTEDFGALKFQTDTIRPGITETESNIEMPSMVYKTVPEPTDDISGFILSTISYILTLLLVTLIVTSSLFALMDSRRIEKEIKGKSGNKLFHLEENKYMKNDQDGKELFHLEENKYMKNDQDGKGVNNLTEDICKICQKYPVFMYCCDCTSFQCKICCQMHMENNKNHLFVKVMGRNEIPKVCDSCRSKVTHYVCSLCKKMFCFSCWKLHDMHEKYIREFK